MLIESIVTVFLTSLLPLPLFAAESTGSTVSVDSASGKIGAEFKSELTWADNGFQDVPGHTPDKTTSIDVTRARLSLTGNINPDIGYQLKFNLLDPANAPLYSGHGTYKFGAGPVKAEISIGKMKVLQGGWDNNLNELSDHVQGVYRKHLVFSKYEPMMALAVYAAGKVTLQVINDVTTADSGQWNDKKHPTFILGWFSEQRTFSPTLAFGSYDNNKSNWIDLGGRLQSWGIDSRLDVKLDTIANKVIVGNKAKTKEDTATSVTFKSAYEIKETATPWIYYSVFEKKQYADSDSRKKDAKVNASGLGSDGKFIFAFNDNGKVLGLGADLNTFGDHWVPYVAFTHTSARFAGTRNPDLEVTKTSNTLHLGCYGSF